VTVLLVAVIVAAIVIALTAFGWWLAELAQRRNEE